METFGSMKVGVLYEVVVADPDGEQEERGS